MAKGKLFAKAHYRGPEHIQSMVDLIARTPEIDGLDVCVFREINGQKLDLFQIGEIIGGRLPFSLEYGDTDDTREVIDFLNPKKTYMWEFVREKLIPAANEMGVVGINFHLVANAQNIHPGELPSRFYSREETLKNFRQILSDFQKDATCQITVENVHCLSTRRNVDDCIKFAPVGNTVQDFSDLNWPATLDTAHLGMSLFTFQVLQYLERKGKLEKVEGLKDYVWCPTQLGKDRFDKDHPGPYLVEFGPREREMLERLPTDPTEATITAIKELQEAGLLKAIHLSNLPGWSKDNLFLFWDNDDWIEGSLDFKKILKFAYHDLGIIVIPELREANFHETEKPGFRKNLLRVIEMLKS